MPPDAAPTQITPPAAPPVEASVSEQWERAKVAADAREAAAGKAQPPKHAPAPPPPPTTAPSPAAAENEGTAETEGEAEAEAEAKAEAKDRNEGAVAPQERVKFREAKRRWYEQANAKEDELAKREAEIAAKSDRVSKVEAAIERGDDEEAIQLLFGTDMNGFQKRIVDRIRGRDPRVDKLDRELREEREARSKLEAQQREEAEAKRVERERVEWCVGLRDELSKHEDPTVAQLAPFGEFVNGLHLPGVFDVQSKSYDGVDYITAEEAAEKVMPQWRALYETLGKIFGERDASIPDAPSGAANRNGSASAKPPAKKAGSKAIAQGKATEASPTNGKGVDDSTLIQRFAQRIAESHD